MSLATKALSREQAKPQFMPSDEIPTAIEVDLSLFSASAPTTKGGMTRNQYRGRIDDAGTVRVRVYHPGQYQDLAGEIVTATEPEADLIVLTDEEGTVVKDGSVPAEDLLAKVEWNLEGNVLVILWAPADADIQSVKAILG